MTAGFEALHHLAGEAERMTRVFTRAEPDPSATYEGHDRSGAVHAVVDAAGTVTDFRLDHEWYDKLDVRMLGSAVGEAVESAGAARLSTWAEGIADAQSTEDEPRTEPPRPVHGPVDINPSRELVDELLYLLHRVGSETAAEAKAATYKPKPVKGTSEGGHVVVAMDGRKVVEVRIETDTRWIGTANNLEIASELRDAFRAAAENVAEAAPRRRATSAITELQALTANPREFVDRLFGIQR